MIMSNTLKGCTICVKGLIGCMNFETNCPPYSSMYSSEVCYEHVLWINPVNEPLSPFFTGQTDRKTDEHRPIA